MTITGQSSLAKDDIDRMVRDAEAHAEEDRRRKEEADTRNQADTLVYQTEKLIRENGDKIDAAEKSKVETAVGALKESLAGADIDAIKRDTEALMQASQGFAQRLYEAASAQQGNPTGPTSGPAGSGASAANDDDVVDAEIVDEPGQGNA
jgi:molecular chaperone DnaK